MLLIATASKPTPTDRANNHGRISFLGTFVLLRAFSKRQRCVQVVVSRVKFQIEHIHSSCSVAIYATYFVLFAHFFYTAYLSRSGKHTLVDKSKMKADGERFAIDANITNDFTAAANGHVKAE